MLLGIYSISYSQRNPIDTFEWENELAQGGKSGVNCALRDLTKLGYVFSKNSVNGKVR